MKKNYLRELLLTLVLLVGVAGSVYGNEDETIAVETRLYCIEVQNEDSIDGVSIAAWPELVGLFAGKDVFAAGETFHVSDLTYEGFTDFVTQWAKLAFEVDFLGEPVGEEGFNGEFLYENVDGNTFQVNMTVCAKDYCNFDIYVTPDGFLEGYCYGFCKVTFTKDSEESFNPKVAAFKMAAAAVAKMPAIVKMPKTPKTPFEMAAAALAAAKAKAEKIPNGPFRKMPKMPTGPFGQMPKEPKPRVEL